MEKFPNFPVLSDLVDFIIIIITYYYKTGLCDTSLSKIKIHIPHACERLRERSFTEVFLGWRFEKLSKFFQLRNDRKNSIITWRDIGINDSRFCNLSSERIGNRTVWWKGHLTGEIGISICLLGFDCRVDTYFYTTPSCVEHETKITTIHTWNSKSNQLTSSIWSTSDARDLVINSKIKKKNSISGEPLIIHVSTILHAVFSSSPNDCSRDR